MVIGAQSHQPHEEHENRRARMCKRHGAHTDSARTAPGCAPMCSRSCENASSDIFIDDEFMPEEPIDCAPLEGGVECVAVPPRLRKTSNSWTHRRQRGLVTRRFRVDGNRVG